MQGENNITAIFEKENPVDWSKIDIGKLTFQQCDNLARKEHFWETMQLYKEYVIPCKCLITKKFYQDLILVYLSYNRDLKQKREYIEHTYKGCMLFLEELKEGNYMIQLLEPLFNDKNAQKVIDVFVFSLLLDKVT